MNKIIRYSLWVGMISACLWAVPSTNGVNGLINMPTAYSINAKEVDLGLNLISLSTPGAIWKYLGN